ncbi:hypothetical protein ACP4OV_000335 [Aristida adscensionis]
MPGDSVVIQLPDPRALRVLARSVLLAVALLSLPWLRATTEPPARRRAAGACAAAAARAGLLLRDLRREGLLARGARAVAIGGADGGCDAHAPATEQGQDDAVRPASPRRMLMMGDSSVDFLLDFGYFGEEADRFGFADRVLKSGGILAAPVDSSLSVFRLPPNYRVVYIGQFAETYVGIKKIAHAGIKMIAHADYGDNGNAGIRMELASSATLVGGGVSGHTAECDRAQLRNSGRKLLLSDITERTRVDSAA